MNLMKELEDQNYETRTLAKVASSSNLSTSMLRFSNDRFKIANHSLTLCPSIDGIQMKEISQSNVIKLNRLEIKLFPLLLDFHAHIRTNTQMKQHKANIFLL